MPEQTSPIDPLIEPIRPIILSIVITLTQEILQLKHIPKQEI